MKKLNNITLVLILSSIVCISVYAFTKSDAQNSSLQESQRIEIGDTFGNVTADISKLRRVMNNSLKVEHASKVNFHYDGNGNYDLSFDLSKIKNISYKLKRIGANVYLIANISGFAQTNTCTGDPCNSCKLITQWPRPYWCKCIEKDCADCKCNHTVSEGRANSKYPNSMNLVEQYRRD
jgi:hypothetical protein